jgi:uncharacterized protein YndB with AHSA1/START domain
VSVRIRVCTTIKAAPADVWDLVAQIDRHVDWMRDAERITFRTARREGVGTEFECLTRVGPVHTTDVLRVTEWRPRAALGIEHRGVVRGRGRFTLRRRPRGRTRFCWEERLTFPGWMGGIVGEQVARPILRAIWRRNLHRLKDQLEN